jgi:hypothetical protein
LYILPITDEEEACEEEAPPFLLPLPSDVILKVIGMGDKGELAESYKVLLRELSCVDKILFLLPISKIGVDLVEKSPSTSRDARIRGHEKKY